MKVFLFDASICNGCHGCQIACKDEHCEQPWLPYAEAQPLTGQYWCKVDEVERGKVPFVHVDYTVRLCDHCDNCQVMEIAGDAMYRREDGFTIIDPVKAKGRKDIADACANIYWNEELQIPQKCTACAHLLDDGWDVPRCVDFCATDALRFMEEDEAIALGAVRTPQGEAMGSKIYYLNIPKRFVVGTFVDIAADEVVIGAKAELVLGDDVVAELATDDFGDFKFDQVEPAVYTVRLTADDKVFEVEADCTEKDLYVGVIDASA